MRLFLKSFHFTWFIFNFLIDFLLISLNFLLAEEFLLIFLLLIVKVTHQASLIAHSSTHLKISHTLVPLRQLRLLLGYLTLRAIPHQFHLKHIIHFAWQSQFTLHMSLLQHQSLAQVVPLRYPHLLIIHRFIHNY